MVETFKVILSLQGGAIDFQFDETAEGRPVKILNVTDEYTRESRAANAAKDSPQQERWPFLIRSANCSARLV